MHRLFQKKNVILLLGMLFSTPMLLQAQDNNCSPASLSEAETAYFNGDFDRTIALLQPCMDSADYTQAQGVRAHALYGRTQYVLGEEASATTAIEGLFVLDPLYEPDPQLPPNFIAFILEIKQQMIAEERFPQPEAEVIEQEIIEPETPTYTDVVPENVTKTKSPANRKALFLGGGAAIAVAAGAAILLGGKSEDPGTETPTWPFPPAHPPQ